MAEPSGLHNKYRPDTLARLIGNESAKNKLRGMIESGKFPSAVLFTGPPSSGKTTIARAFVNDVLEMENVPENLTEVNFGADRSIEDIRSLTALSRLRPAHGSPRRFILGDEAHQVVTNKPAADALLKPLEEPVATTTFLLCSMDPEKFATSVTGRAIASRCLNIQLTAPSPEELKKQAIRIIKGEEMSAYISQEAVDKVVASSESFRVLANNLEMVQAYWTGLKEKPKTLPLEAVESSLNLGTTSDDVVATRFLVAVYDRKYVAAHREILSITDGFGFINKCIWLNWFVHNQVVLKEARHPKVWGNSNSFALWKQVKAVWTEAGLNRENQILITSETLASLTALKLGSGSFSVDEKVALSSSTYLLIKNLKSLTE